MDGNGRGGIQDGWIVISTVQVEQIYRDLNDFRTKYFFAKGKEKDRIENDVRLYAEGIDDEIYLEMSNGSAGGLFKSAFFESDLDRALSILDNIDK